MKYIIIMAICLSSIAATAQSDHANWFTNQAEAMSHASEHQQNILMVFAGSDWCRPCIKLKKDILQDDTFSAYAQDHLTILYLDFPAKKKNRLSKEQTTQNEALAEQFNQSGSFPKVMLVDHNLKKIKEVSYNNQSVEDFLSAL